MSEQVLDDFSVGDVLSKSFSVFFKNIIPFSILGIIVYLPFYLTSLYFENLDPTAPATLDFESVFGGIAIFAFYLVFSYLVYGGVTYGTIRDLQGRPASFGEIISKGISTFLPVFGVALVSSIAIGFGFILLIIPGIIIAIVLYVAIPVVVIERPSVFESLSRSADLTKDYRWKIFGLGLVVYLIFWVAAIIMGLFSLAGLAIYSAVDVLFSSFTISFGAVVAAVTYQELRRVKEGVDIDTIASVFS